MFDWQSEFEIPVTSTTYAPPLFHSSVMIVSSMPFTNATHAIVAPAATSKLLFAQALRGPQVQFSDPLPAPSIRGETLSIKINDSYF
jgi:hypothetical protein